MYISLNWLKEFVNIPKKISPQQLGLDLTMHTVEIEEIKRRGDEFKNIVVGRIKDIKKHPNADKLVIVVTDIGSEKLQIVCGGINLKKGMLVAVALSGARVRWHGQGEPVELGDVEIRGVKSRGMICAANEIGLGETFPHKEKEILDLSHIGEIYEYRLRAGEPLAQALKIDDIIYEVDNKSLTHRGDLWGHLGIAREIAAFTGFKFRNATLKSIKEGKKVNLKVEVKDQKLCPRYSGLVLENIKVGPSPLFLRSRLEACGIRSINNIVDITNYVMLELGQPMHAFNARLVNNDKIVVRNAKKGETITALDANQYQLDSSMLVIADDKKALALAGVMGGQSSEIKEDTTSIVLESANFDPVSIRQTSAKLGLRTESSMRFEKSLDPNLTPLAIIRAVNLIQEIIPEAKVASALVDVKKFKLNQGPIILPLEFLWKRIGEKIPEERIVNILESLGFDVKLAKDHLSVIVPTWRATRDINIPEDLIEEVARIYGYDNIRPKMPEIELRRPLTNEELNLGREVRMICAAGLGMTEVYNYSFLGKELFNNCGFDFRNNLHLTNPLSEDLFLLRPSLLPGLLLSVKKNLKYFEQFNIFELGRVFKNEKGEFGLGGKSNEFLPKQHKYLAGIEICGEAPFYRVKNDLAVILNQLNFSYEFIKMKGTHPSVHPVRVLSVVVSGKVVGLITEINPLILNNLGIKKRVGYFEISLTNLSRLNPQEVKYESLPKYPNIKLDLAVIVPCSVEWLDIKNLVQKTGGGLVQKIELFDIYRGEEIGKDKKSLAFHIIYRSSERTLESKEARRTQEKIIKALEKDFGAEIRK